MVVSIPTDPPNIYLVETDLLASLNILSAIYTRNATAVSIDTYIEVLTDIITGYQR